MGQAKQKSAIRIETKNRLAGFDISRLASAVRRLSVSASSKLGSDCFIHAMLAKEVLIANNIQADLVVGFAAWRTGEGDSDVVVHAPLPNMPMQPGGVAYHVWLEVAGMILDVTTYQLREKGRQLDLLDGGHTSVDWCPDYLFIAKDTVSPLKDVAREHTGMYYYERVQALEKKILGSSHPPDPQDIKTVFMLFDNPGMVVFGPNDVVNCRKES